MSNLAEKIDFSEFLPDAPPRDFSFFPGELNVFRKKEELTPSQWTPKHRVVSVSSIPGPWRNENAPYLVFIMDTWGREHVRKVIVCAGSQLGKTEGAYNCYGYGVVYDPGPALIVMPSEKAAGRVAEDRIIPMVDDCAPLRALKSKNPDDTGKTRIKYRNGTFTYLAWSNSPALLASTPIKYLVLDEVDLYAPDAKNQAEARTRTFKHEKKIYEVSTPSFEDGTIWVDLTTEAQEIWDYYAVCPTCGDLHRFDFSRIIIPPGVTDPKKVVTNNSARYRCDCGAEWDDADKWTATQAGEWIIRPLCNSCDGNVELIDGVCPECHGTEMRQVEDASVVGFHLPAFFSQFVSISDIAAAYLTTLLDPTPSNLRYFYNDFLALPVPDNADGETADEKHIYERREDYAPKGALWSIPMEACLLLMSVDVQDNRLEYEIVAWGPGKQTWGIETASIMGSPGRDDVWRQLDDVREKTFLHESGVRLRISACGIDTGGHHTDEAYKYVKKRQAQRVYALKGANTPGKPLTSKPTTKNRRRVRLYTVGTETAKDSLIAWLQVTEPGPRHMHFPRTYGLEYFRQLCSEKGFNRKDKRTGRTVRVWAKKKGYNRNEALDLRVYNLAAFDILNPNLEKLSRDLLSQVGELEEDASEQVRGALRKAVEGRLRKKLEKLDELPEEEREEAEARLERAKEVLTSMAPLARKKKKVIKKRKTGFASRMKG